MAKHQELISIALESGKYRFCLDRVIRDDEDNRIEYAFVWRGTAVSPDGFVLRPAYFNFQLLGQLLHKAIADKVLSQEDVSKLLLSLVGRR